MIPLFNSDKLCLWKIVQILYFPKIAPVIYFAGLTALPLQLHFMRGVIPEVDDSCNNIFISFCNDYHLLWADNFPLKITSLVIFTYSFQDFSINVNVKQLMFMRRIAVK